jgi:putative transposase
VSAIAQMCRRHRFPLEVIEQCVWLYFRFCVSYRDVEEMMARRGVRLTYETVREWCSKFGPVFAQELKRRNRRKLGSKWHLDEVFIKMNGAQHYLWRAVDEKGAVIDILVQPKRDRLAAERFFRKLLRTAGKAPRVIITDKLRSYGAAKRTLLPDVIHRQSRYLNNRAENSHQPTRQRERRMKRFQSSEQAQRFLSVFEPINTHFRLRRHLLPADRYRRLRNQAIAEWVELVGMSAAA